MDSLGILIVNRSSIRNPMMNLEEYTNYPCVFNAMITIGLSKLFKDHPSDANDILRFGCQSIPNALRPTTLKEALMGGHYPGTLVGGFKNIQRNRLRAQNVYAVIGDRDLKSINENDLWLWHMQLHVTIPTYDVRRNQVCRTTRDERTVFETFKSLQPIALKNLRKMISSIHPILFLASNFQMNWRKHLHEEDWDDKDHPFNQLLTRNIGKPLFAENLQGYERNGHLEQEQLDALEEMLDSHKNGLQEKKKAKKIRKINRTSQTQVDIEEVLNAYPCCMDATKIQGLQALQNAYPSDWVQCLNYLQSHTKISPKMTVRDAIRLGYYPKTIPISAEAVGSSFSSIKRNRERASKWLQHPLATRRIVDVIEDDLWLIHAQITVGDEDRFSHKELAALRSILHRLQKNLPIRSIYGKPVLSVFNWNWRTQYNRCQWNRGSALDRYLFGRRRDVRLRKYFA